MSNGTLRLQDGGWILEAPDGSELDSGDYPLKEDEAFIEAAAEALIEYRLPGQSNMPDRAAVKDVSLMVQGGKPYTKVDERDR